MTTLNNKKVGGIVGYAYNSTQNEQSILLKNNTNNIAVETGDIDSNNIAGGIVAVAKNIKLVSNINNGSVENSYIAGGIVGYSYGCKIEGETSNNANVTAQAIAGGIVAIADGKPRQLGLKDILEYYVNYQQKVIYNRIIALFFYIINSCKKISEFDLQKTCVS